MTLFIEVDEAKEIANGKTREIQEEEKKNTGIDVDITVKKKN